ncbi:MAG: hypothetical protein ACHQYP_06555 [Nitrospiria bacterium]
METGTRLITVRGIQKIPECQKLTRFFVNYLRDLRIVSGTKVLIKKREVWKYTLQEAALIQSVWHFRKRGFDLTKSIELAQKSQTRRDQKRMEPNLYSDLAS